MDQRLKNITILLLTCWFFYSCSTSENQRQQIFSLYEAGNFSEAGLIIDKVIANNPQPEVAEELGILHHRVDPIAHDFSKTEAEITSLLRPLELQHESNK